MKGKVFWSGFAAGAGTAIAGAFALGFIGRGGSSRIIRLEKSVQIAKPVEDVFESWCALEEMPRYTSMVRHVQRRGDRSRWIVEVGGRRFEWEAEIVQVIPNQTIGWKSVEGTKLTGRVTFSPLADNTVVHIQMNYAPKPWFIRPALTPFSGQLESYIEQALREFKSALEAGKGRKAVQTDRTPTQATGTYGPTRDNPRFGTPTIPVEFTAPPESKR